MSGSNDELPEHDSDFYRPDVYSAPYGTRVKAVIVGKGSSLDGLMPSVLAEDGEVFRVVFAINEAAHRVLEWHYQAPRWLQWYLVQQDSELGDSCFPTRGETVALINRRVTVSPRQRCPVAIHPYDPGRFGCDDSTLTAIIAVKIARLWGIKRLAFVAFDSWKDPKALGYYSKVPYAPGGYGRGDPQRFVQHKALILKACEGCEVEVI